MIVFRARLTRLAPLRTTIDPPADVGGTDGASDVATQEWNEGLYAGIGFVIATLALPLAVGFLR